MNTALMFSKATDEWATPDEFFGPLYSEFAFSLDAAANRENRVCPVWFGPGHDRDEAWRDDALRNDWHDDLRERDADTVTVWLNPPYSKCREFIAKAAEEARKGCIVVCLVPSRTDTRWFHEHVWDAEKHQPRPGVEIRFIKGRLRFGGSTNCAPFPSVVIVFRPVTR